MTGTCQKICIAAAFALTMRCAGWQETTQPATAAAAPTNHERLKDLLALVEGQNTPEGRRTIARELLLQRWPETPPRLLLILNGSNGPAKTAVATALADLPQALEPAFVDPLLGMLADGDGGVRQAAGQALAAYSNFSVTQRLRALAVDSSQPKPGRLAAIAALGLMTEREAIEGLVGLLSDPDPVVASAALTSMSQATAIDFGDDSSAARAWWDESSALSREDWQQLQIDRLVHNNREMRRRLDATETRLGKALEANFVRAADAERITMLTAYLSDSALSVRLTGLHLGQKHLTEGRVLPAELQDRIRDLINNPDAHEQAAAIQTVASLREPHDAATFAAMLENARNREVRLALLNGLGYVGSSATTTILLPLLDDTDEPCAVEAIAALGRLAERGVLDPEARDRVAAALLAAFQRTQPAQVTARERVLWAMANVADVRFGPAFVAALDKREGVPVRLAAIRGIGGLKNPQLADALAEAANDADAGARKAAIEMLAVLGSAGSDKQIQALWERVVSPQETDESIRQLAWRAVLEILSKGSGDDVERWIARLPGTTAKDTQRRIELLEHMTTMVQQAEPLDRGRLGLIRARLAAQYARLEQPGEAIGSYVGALGELQATKSDATRRVALELLRYALANGGYDQTVAAALATTAGSAAEREALWQSAKAEVEARLTPTGVDQVLTMLTALGQYPPGEWPPQAASELQKLRERAQALRPPATELRDFGAHHGLVEGSLGRRRPGVPH